MPSKKLQRPKEPKASKEQFLRAAAELFDENGYFNTSVEDIIKKAGRSKGGFYHHFKSKEALFKQLFGKMMEDKMSLLLDRIKRGVPLRTAVVELFAELKKMHLATSQLKRSMEIYLISLHDRNSLTVVQSFHKKTIGMFEKILEVGKQRGELEFSLPLHKMAEMLYDSNRGIFFMDTIVNGGRRAMERMLQHLLYELDALEKKADRHLKKNS